MEYKKEIFLEGKYKHHVQGIATDNKYMYLSFTTELIKTDMQGNLIGSVKGLAGHLGCIAMNYENGLLYGSLEFKHDSIGTGILNNIGKDITIEDGFYIVIFDVEKITKCDMDAETDGVMKAVYLKDVFDDYSYKGHKYGCSGIDGTTFAPSFGEQGDKNCLYVAYGIYEDKDRSDNNNQVILKYDVSCWDKYAKPLNQLNMHKSGPEKPDGKYFLYTGNTNWGIQNLEYDKEKKCIMAAVYRGSKEEFINYDMFFIDTEKEALFTDIKGINEKGYEIFLKDNAEKDINGLSGSFFPYGSTGMISLGNNLYYFSENFRTEKGNGTNVCLYKFVGGDETFEKI